MRGPGQVTTWTPRAAPRRVAYDTADPHFKGISGDIADVARALLKDRSLPEFGFHLSL